MGGTDAIKMLAEKLVLLLQQRGLTVATAESCTGGRIAAAITSVAGCSAVMLGGVVAYHNNVKAKVLGVSENVLAEYGAVSEPVVRQMVQGVAALTGADCAVATSGIAGPGGGTPGKPVGTVWVALKVGDVVAVAEKSVSNNFFKKLKEDDTFVAAPKWLDRDKNTLQGKVLAMPTKADIDFDIAVHLIVELYSK